MRVIKFRCFNTAAKMMYPNEHFALTMDGAELQLMPACSHYDKPYISHSGDMIYMQYTGLRDTNGTEIYEGDIVSQYGIDAQVKPVVEYHEASFKTTWFTRRLILTESQALTLEVIGNIHENLELLK